MAPGDAGLTLPSMNREFTADFPKDVARRQLVWVRNDLAERLGRIRRDAAHRAAPLSADAPDRIQQQQNDEVLARLEASTAVLLGQYEHALERMDQGFYGVCEDCNYPIERDRLNAVPQATRCTSCSRESAAQAA